MGDYVTMKETIYTIPINEAFELQDGTCPVCRLAGRLERDALEYVMGAAMMEPDVRMETNRLGFCGTHFGAMMKMGNRLPLSLVLESYLLEQRKTLKNAKTSPADTCFVCHRRDGYQEAYYKNIFYIWETDPAFQDKFSKAALCYPHMGELLTRAPSRLKRKVSDRFREDLLRMADAKFAVLSPLVTTFCRSFDHRFSDEPLGEAKTAVEDTIAWLTGAGEAE